MASILDFLNSDKGQQFAQKAGEQLGESPEKVKNALGAALPMMLGAMNKNAKSPEGAASLNQALEDNKHDGSLLDNLGGVDLSSLLGDGAGILGNVFGNKQDKVEQAVGASTGMDSSKISKLLKMAAPVVLSLLGNQKRKDNVDQGGISNLLGSVLGKDSSHDQSLLESFLDSDSADISSGVNKIFGGNGKGLGKFF